MAPHHDEDRLVSYHTTAIAIDKDKNSQSAVRWAIENLINTSPNLILIHVRVPKYPYQNSTANEISDANRQILDSEMSHLFVPYRGFCARKGVQAKEVVLEDADVSKAILEYISTNCVNNVVVGASARNALTRKFKNPDLSSSLMKSAPEFCAVFVISKGKVQTVRSAKRPASNTATPPRQPPPSSAASIGLPPTQHDFHDQEDSVKTPFGRRGWRSAGAALPERKSVDRGTNDFMRTPGRERPLSTIKNASNEQLLMEGFDMSMRSQRASHSRESRDSFSDDIDFSGALTFGSCDISAESLEFSNNSDAPRASISGQASREMEAEMKRLKQELRQTMDLYSTACKEAISAKQKAQELHQWKLEEVRRFEEARLAEEAALQMAEIEKAKCKAAIEAAEASQRLAELEAQKRRHAEMKAMKETAEKKRALDRLANNEVRYRKYTLEEIEVATEYFADNLKIGEGGYGPVYKALLDHTRVAIKVLRPDAAQGRRQFQQEVEVLSCIRHPNMVLLLGACPEYGCLVYEFMDNGSLDDRIFRRGNTPTIPWTIRFKIAAEIATALLFLHQAKPEPLVHRDLKPANILLDRNYTSKISDVGLSRLVPPSVADTVTQYRMTSTAGTFCYIDPEYQQTGMLGIKSDIYSLGIMLLQIVTAKPPMGLTHHVERAIEKGTFADMLDPTITDWPMDDVLSYTKMALKCAELRRKDRPDLGSVVLPELNRLRSLGYRESGSTSNSYGSHSCSNESNSRLRSSNTSQEAMKSNPRRSTLDEGGRNSNPGGAVNDVERSLVPKMFEAE